ncbi:MAG: acylphosphatase [Gemmatimonadetes bacterium]|nr:acylphosphatase [Gemmatimonadota bacterium]
MGDRVTDARRAVRVRVAGRVQRVGFRWFVQRQAEALGLAGSVRNTSDGLVEVIAFGAADQVSRLLDALRQGPPQARVQSVDVEERTAPASSPSDHFEVLP